MQQKHALFYFSHQKENEHFVGFAREISRSVRSDATRASARGHLSHARGPRRILRWDDVSSVSRDRPVARGFDLYQGNLRFVSAATSRSRASTTRNSTVSWTRSSPVPRVSFKSAVCTVCGRYATASPFVVLSPALVIVLILLVQFVAVRETRDAFGVEFVVFVLIGVGLIVYRKRGGQLPPHGPRTHRPARRMDAHKMGRPRHLPAPRQKRRIQVEAPDDSALYLDMEHYNAAQPRPYPGTLLDNGVYATNGAPAFSSCPTRTIPLRRHIQTHTSTNPRAGAGVFCVLVPHRA